MKTFLQKMVTTSMVNAFVEKQLNARFDHSHYGLKPKHRCQQTLPQPCLAISMLRLQPWKPS